MTYKTAMAAAELNYAGERRNFSTYIEWLRKTGPAHDRFIDRDRVSNPYAV